MLSVIICHLCNIFYNKNKSTVSYLSYFLDSDDYENFYW